jgi:hypothetical protein
MRRRLTSGIQLEDLALVAVVLLGPLLAGEATGSIADDLLGGGRDPVLGVVAVVAAVGAMAALATRVPSESRIDEPQVR